MTLTFALLTQTRRTAKVRWRHIMRIALYSVAFTMPLLWWAALWQVPDFGLLVVLGMCGISLGRWGFGCGAYLHLPRPWFVASMLTIMLLLLGIALQYHFLHD